MGITYGDHLIDSGYYDITPEQESEMDNKAVEQAGRSSAEPVAWRSMDSAPKDGADILLGGCKHGPSVQIGSWGAHGPYIRSSKSYGLAWGNGGHEIVDPTHWQPLPTAPSPEQEKRDA